jgi:hypothetical protein
MDPSPESSAARSAGWYSLWAVTLAASLVPVAVFYFNGLPAITEAFRSEPLGLLPAPILFIRWQNDCAKWMPFLLLAVPCLTQRKPQWRNALIASSAVVTTLFYIFYVCYLLMFLSLYLPALSDRDKAPPLPPSQDSTGKLPER